MSKTQSKKLLYVIAVVAMLAMLIPLAAAPVAAADPVPLLPPLQPTVIGTTLDPAEARDIVGHIQRFTATGTFNVASWTVNNTDPVGADASIVGTPVLGVGGYVDVRSYQMGASVITATNAAGATQTGEKKWGKIDRTFITPPQDVDVVWNEQEKTFEADATVTDTVWGTFWYQDSVHGTVLRESLAAGAILDWYLLQDNPFTQAWIAANSGWMTQGALLAGAATLPRATFAEFVGSTIDPTHTQSTTLGTPASAIGTSTQTIVADGEEPVLVLVIPHYSFTTENLVMIEWTKVNFWTYEMEKVPQVRWAGEKIVLEKYFGPGYAGNLVRFSLENQSPGALEGLNGTSLVNLNNTAQTVWDVVDNEGYANVMFVSEAPGEVDIDLALYDQKISISGTPTAPIIIITNPDGTPRGPVINQHGFVVFYLKLEDITLGNVRGKRAQHNAGLWTPPNPWYDPSAPLGSQYRDDPATPKTNPNVDEDADVTAATLNVSQDDLLRARVRGWFMGDNLSMRPEVGQDYDGDGTDDVLLPKGRWVLPDDWPKLAGPDWREQRLHWDIMDNPKDSIVSPWNDPKVPWAKPVSDWRPDIANALLPNGKPNPSYQDNLGMGNYYNYYVDGTKVPKRNFNNTSVLGGATKMLVAAYPVIGPYRPGGEFPTSFGYVPQVLNWPDAPDILRKSVVSSTQTKEVQPALPPSYTSPSLVDLYPNGVLEWWDAPMPPAKITFKIMDTFAEGPVTGGIGNAGFFKEAWKSDIYYLNIDDDSDTNTPALKVYTAPFYWEMIPASPYIPAFVNNGGYDWDSWVLIPPVITNSVGGWPYNSTYGPYPFWKIINRPTTADDPSAVPSTDSSNYPTKVQVYSDNNGEAMVYINGNWNLNQLLFTPKGLDIPFGSTVGSSTIVAMADYPYFRKHPKLISNSVTKTWTWGGMILGGEESADKMVLTVGAYTPEAGNPTYGFSNDKLVFVWATDRDGKQPGVLGTMVDWLVSKNQGPGATIPPITTVNGVSTYQRTPGDTTMQNINISNGFLNNTGGVLTGSMDGTAGRSWLRIPTAAEKVIFNKFWGVNGTNAMLGADGLPLNPDNFAVAAIDLLDTTKTSDVNVSITLTGPDFGIVVYHVNVNFTFSYPLDDDIVPGDANVDGKVNMADITAIERIILGLNSPTASADANRNNTINMGDVVKAERSILGLK